MRTPARAGVRIDGSVHRLRPPGPALRRAGGGLGRAARRNRLRRLRRLHPFHPLRGVLMATRSHSRTSGADRGRRDRDTASARGRRGTGPRRSPATVWAGLRARLVPSGEVTQEFLLLTVTVVALAVVLIPGIGVEVGGARRWIDFGALRFQPTELAKLSLPLYLSSLLARRWAQLRAGDLHALLMPALPLLCLMAVLVMGEPDLETAALIVAIGGIVLFAAGLPARLIAWAVGALGLFGVAAIAFTPFRRARLAAWFDPMAYADTYGYQTVQGFIALGSGGLLGVGLGQSRGKWLYVPNAHTDFIYAIIGEELGLAGAMFVLLLFALLAVGGFRTARLAPDPFGRLLAASITGWLLLQAAINIGSVVGLLPVTGVTLPLVSFGGSSLVFTMAGYGLLLSLSRQATPARSGTRAGDHPGHRARQRRDQRFRARTSSTRATGAGG